MYVVINIPSLDESKHARSRNPETENVGEEWSLSHNKRIELGYRSK